MSHTAAMVSRQVVPQKGWSIQMRAISTEDPADLLEILSETVLDCGAWVLSQGADDNGVVNILFEFERQACIDVYSAVVATGLELSQSSHIRFTELCQCTVFQSEEYADEVAGIDLEIQTFSSDLRAALESASAA